MARERLRASARGCSRCPSAPAAGRRRRRRRSASVWPMMISRNERPSRASISDLGCCRPIVVASPPLSLISTTVRQRAAAGSTSGRSLERRHVAGRLQLGAGQHRRLARLPAAGRRCSKARIASGWAPAARIFSLCRLHPRFTHAVIVPVPANVCPARHERMRARWSSARSNVWAAASASSVSAPGSSAPTGATSSARGRRRGARHRRERGRHLLRHRRRLRRRPQRAVLRRAARAPSRRVHRHQDGAPRRAGDRELQPRELPGLERSLAREPRHGHGSTSSSCTARRTACSRTTRCSTRSTRWSSGGRIAAYGVSVETCAQALAAIARPHVATVQIILNCFRLKPLEEVLPGGARRRRRDHRAGAAGLRAAVGSLRREHAPSTPSDHRNYNRHGEAFDVGETFAGVPYEVGVRGRA